MATEDIQFEECIQLAECVEQLEERAKPSKNDIRYEKYVKYVNCFISKFGKEKVYLVGSTGERSKLAYSKDDGDADFLVVSGRLDISPENLEFNSQTPCYIRILADDRSRNTGLKVVDDKYLSANTLRELRPELFTLLRAIYSQVTAIVDRLPESDAAITVISVPSKVGLQLTNYRSLEFDSDIAEHRRHLPRVSNDIREQERRDVDNRWQDVKVHDHDKKLYRRLHKVLKLVVQQEGKRENNGGIAFFAQFVEDGLNQQTMDSATDVGTDSRADGNTNCGNDEEHFKPTFDLENPKSETQTKTCIKATYTEKQYKDFVPALVINGKLNSMNKWKERVEELHWPQPKVNNIYSTDIFVVARESPINPNSEVDFCLSFNLAEQKLMKSMSIAQRKVFLILKAFVKGTFERNHRQKGKELKLKTYHVKTLLFWFNEQSVCELEGEQYLHFVLQAALDFLRGKLLKKELSHYFVQSNLFADFEATDFELLIECVDEAKNDPVLSLMYYIEMNDGKRGEVWFNEAELNCLLEMSEDGGRNKHVHRLKDAMVDFQRGVNDSQRDKDGNSPLREAITDTLRVCLAEEGSVDCTLFEQFNNVITKGESDLSKLDRSEVNKTIMNIVEFVDGLQNEFPRIKEFLNKFGGKEGVIDILRGALHGKAVDFSSDLREQILETVNRFLSCSDEEEDAHLSELKYKLAGYFLCQEEFQGVSGLRHV